MDERIRLPNGQVVVLSADMAPEERERFLSDMRTRFGVDEFESVGPPQTYGRMGAPVGGGRIGRMGDPIPPGGITTLPSPTIPTPSPTTDYSQPAYEEPPPGGYERTVGGHVATLFKSIPIGLQQAFLMAKAGALGIASPDRETQEERDTRAAIENLILKIDPAYRDSHMAELGMALGTMGGIAAPAMIPGVGWGAAFVGAGLMGAGEQAERMARHEEDTGEDISAGKEILGMAAGLGIGFSEMMPMGRLVKRGRHVLTGGRRGAAKTVEELTEEAIEQRLKRTGVGGVVRSAGRQALEEAVQESAAGFSQNVVARGLYDDNAFVGATSQAFKEALLGGEVGAIADLAISMTQAAIGGPARRRFERIRAASQHIRKAYREGIEAGTIDDGLQAALEVDENGEWVDQSPDAIEVRDGLRLTPESIADGTLTSQMTADAAALFQQAKRSIEQEFKDGSIDEGQKDAQLKELQQESLELGRVFRIGGARIAEVETGVDPTALSDAEVDKINADAEQEAKVEKVVEEAISDPVTKPPMTAEEARQLPDYDPEIEERLWGPKQETEEQKTTVDGETARVIAEETLQGEEEVRAAERLAQLMNPNVSDEVIEQIGVDTTSPLAEQPTFTIGATRDLVYDELTPSREAFKEEERQKLRQEADATNQFVVAQQEEMEYLESVGAGLGEAEAEAFVTEQMKPVEAAIKRADPKVMEDELAALDLEIKEAQEIYQKRRRSDGGIEKLIKEMSKINGEIQEASSRLQQARSVKNRAEFDKVAALIRDLQADRIKLQEDMAQEEAADQEMSDDIERKATRANKLSEKLADEARVSTENAHRQLLERFGATEEERRANYIEAQLPLRAAVIQSVQEGATGATTEGGIPLPNALGEQSIIPGSENLVLGFPIEGLLKNLDPRQFAAIAAEVESYIEDRVTKLDEHLFGPSNQRNLMDLAERLRYEGQRMALAELQRRVEANPSEQLNAAGIKGLLSRIFGGGLIDINDVQYEDVYTFEAGEPSPGQPGVMEAVQEEALEMDQLRAKDDPTAKLPDDDPDALEFEVTANTPALERFNAKVPKAEQVTVGTKISRAMRNDINDATLSDEDAARELEEAREAKRVAKAELHGGLVNTKDIKGVVEQLRVQKARSQSAALSTEERNKANAAAKGLEGDVKEATKKLAAAKKHLKKVSRGMKVAVQAVNPERYKEPKILEKEAAVADARQRLAPVQEIVGRLVQKHGEHNYQRFKHEGKTGRYWTNQVEALQKDVDTAEADLREARVNAENQLRTQFRGDDRMVADRSRHKGPRLRMIGKSRRWRRVLRDPEGRVDPTDVLKMHPKKQIADSKTETAEILEPGIGEYSEADTLNIMRGWLVRRIRKKFLKEKEYKGLKKREKAAIKTIEDSGDVDTETMAGYEAELAAVREELGLYEQRILEETAVISGMTDEEVMVEWDELGSNRRLGKEELYHKDVKNPEEGMGSWNYKMLLQILPNLPYVPDQATLDEWTDNTSKMPAGLKKWLLTPEGQETRSAIDAMLPVFAARSLKPGPPAPEAGRRQRRGAVPLALPLGHQIPSPSNPLIARVQTAEGIEGPKENVVMQGTELFMAMRGGPPRPGRKPVARQIAMGELTAIREVSDSAERVMDELFQTPTLVSLGLWLDKNAVDQPAVNSNPESPPPKTVPTRLQIIRQSIIRNKTVQFDDIVMALIARGMAKGKLVETTVDVTPSQKRKVVTTLFDRLTGEPLPVKGEPSRSGFKQGEWVDVETQTPPISEAKTTTPLARFIKGDKGGRGEHRIIDDPALRDELKQIDVLIAKAEARLKSGNYFLKLIAKTNEELPGAKDLAHLKPAPGVLGAAVKQRESLRKERENDIEQLRQDDRDEITRLQQRKAEIDLLLKGNPRTRRRRAFGAIGVAAYETQLDVEEGFVKKVIDSTIGTRIADQDISDKQAFEQLSLSEKFMVLERILSSKKSVVHTTTQKPLRVPDKEFSVNQARELIDRIRDAGVEGFNIHPSSKDMKSLVEASGVPSRVLREFVQSDPVFERIGETNRYRMAQTVEAQEVVVLDEQVRAAETRKRVTPKVEEGHAAEPADDQWHSRADPKAKATVEERVEELVNAKERIVEIKRAARRRAIMLFGRQKGSEVAIDIEAAFDSIYEDYADTISDRSNKAYVDTYTGAIVLNVSQLEKQYADSYKNLWDVPVEVLVKDAMLHEGAHILMLEGILTNEEKRNLKLFGERERVPESVSDQAVHSNGTRMTWRQWVESQPGSSQMNEAEVTEEMQVQLLDALATGQIKGTKPGSILSVIKERILNYLKVLVGIQEEAGSLTSILSVFDKLQNQVEVARRMQVAADQGLADLRFAERADPKDLKDLMEAMKEGNDAKVAEIATRIAHKRSEGFDKIPAVSPSQHFLNQMRAKQELEETPKGVVSILNGGVLADIRPEVLAEYFTIQDGKPPYIMDKPRRELLGRRRKAPMTDDDEAALKLMREDGSKSDPEAESPRQALEAISINKGKDGKIHDATPEDIKRTWEYNAQMRFRKAFLDKRLPQALTSQMAEARKAALNIQSSIDSITAWRYADNAQSFLPALWEHGPLEVVGNGFKVVEDRFVDLKDEVVVIQTEDGPVELLLSEGGKVETMGLGPMFEDIIDSPDDLEMARKYGESARVLGNRGRLDQVRAEFVEHMVEAGFDRAALVALLNTPEGKRLGGLKLDKQGKPVITKRKKVKGNPAPPPMAKQMEIARPDKLTPEQAAVWDRYIGYDNGLIGVWQRKYDIVLPPGNAPLDPAVSNIKLSQEVRYDKHVERVRVVQHAAKNSQSSGAKVVRFWRNFRAFNHVMIELSHKAEIIDDARRDLYQSISWMPFYRDETGWGDASLFENDHSPEATERQAREKEARTQGVSSDSAGKQGTPLFDRNIEGSHLPITDDLVGSLMKNIQANVRDSMWNIAANGTVDDGTLNFLHGLADKDKHVPLIREQKFLTWNDITEGDRIAFTEAGDPWVAGQQGDPSDVRGSRLTAKQKEIMYERRDLWTPEQLNQANFSSVTIRVKKKGEPKYYRTLDPHLAEAVMNVGVSPSQILQEWFVENTPMNEQWARGATKIMMGASSVLRDAVTLSPIFWGKNVLRDSWQAGVTFGHGPQLVWGAIKNFTEHFLPGQLGQKKMVWDPDLEGGNGAYRTADRSRGEVGEGAYERATRLGLAVGIDFVRDPKQAHKQAQRLVQERELKWDTPTEFAKNALWVGPMKMLRRAAGQSEIATRLAIYDTVMEKTGGNHAQAFKQALEIINYGRRGSNELFSVLTALSPFMNGRIQGLDVTWRTHWGSSDQPGIYPGLEGWLERGLGTGPPSAGDINDMLGTDIAIDEDGKLVVQTRADYDKLMYGGDRGLRVAITASRGMFMMAMTSLYYLMMHDEEEYKNAREDEKNDYWLMPWGTKVPIPFEVGTIYKVIPEQLLRLITEAEHDAADVTEEAKRQITASLGLSPVPQLFRPAWDALRNRDRFQKDDIVPQWMEDDLLAPHQVRSSTSLVARGLSTAFGGIPLVNTMDFLTSPMKMEYMLRQYTGTMGAYAITMTDALLAHTMGINRVGTAFNFGTSSLFAPFTDDTAENMAERLAHWNRVPILGDLIRDPREGGGYQEDFYEWVEVLDEVVTTLGQIEGRGDWEKAEAFEDRHEAVLKHRNQLRHFESQMEHWRSDRDFLLERKDLTREEKQARLLWAYEARDRMLDEMIDIMADIKSGRTAGETLRSMGISALETPDFLP